MHVLDNPVWHALIGTHATVAERALYAARYDPEVALFSAVPDIATPPAWEGLRDLIGAGNRAVLARCEIAAPPAWTAQIVAPCRQMVMPDATTPAPAGKGSPPADDIVPLTEDDVPEMLALVERTRPGPFLYRTIELGTYIGVRRDGGLIAMAGERLRPAGYTEISAVCTDAAYRGTGLASRLVEALVGSIRARGEVPFLHLRMDNESAHRVYAALGFETRSLLDVIAVQAPA